MKLLAGAALSVLFLAGSDVAVRPEPFFVKENKIYYTYCTTPLEGEAAKYVSRIEITSVTNNGKSTLSEGIFIYAGGTAGAPLIYRVRFACDSLNYYVNTTNWLYEPIAPSEEVQLKLAGDSLWYPLGMKVGDTLRWASATSKYSSSITKDAYTVSFQNRKVISLDSISTPFGRQLAFEIVMDVKYNSVYSSLETKGRRKEEMVVTEWFVPSIGIVKSEYRDPSFGNSRIVMESYKK